MAIEALRDIQKSAVSAFTGVIGGVGIATIDFGVNGADRASTFILLNDANIGISTTVVLCGIRGMGSNDHTFDEHLVEQMDIRAGNIVNGQGFEIYAVTRNVKLYGQWSVFWQWRN